MSKFVSGLQEIENNKTTFTENGARVHATTGKHLVDMNFKASSYRNKSEGEIVTDFVQAFAEDELLAVKWLFYARDVRGGMGERRLFRVILKHLGNTHPEIADKIAFLIPEYGRWDDLFELLNTKSENTALRIIANQLFDDLSNKYAGKPISLLAKWMPSINRRQKNTRNRGMQLAKKLGFSNEDYTGIVSKLRKPLNLVETKMSKQEWDTIDYSAVPSKANLLYNKAFFRHDQERRLEFFNKVERGEAKINGGTNFPHDIVVGYNNERYYDYRSVKDYDQNLEALWKALPQYGELNNTLVVMDGSGSMYSNELGATKTKASDVACALALYFSERCVGEFRNKFITFSETPKFIDTTGDGSLHSRLSIANSYDEVANTDIEAVFDLILKVAVSKKLEQAEMPSTILILSDMEFDEARGYRYYGHESDDKTLFAEIAKRFENAGYKLPKLAFWNIMGRTGGIPVKENDNGVALVSGFSPASINIVLSGKMTPYDALVDVLSRERYAIIEEMMNRK